MLDCLFGIQHQNGTIPDVHRIDYARLGGVKLLGLALKDDLARYIRSRAPHCHLTLRLAVGEDSDYKQDPVKWSARLLEAYLPILRAVGPDNLAVEINNEPVISNDVEALQLSKFTRTCATILHANGFKQVIAYNFSVGNPAYELWQYLYDGLAACELLGMHLYNAPRMDSPAMNDKTFRYRKSLIPLGKPIIATEFGIDCGTEGYLQGGGGYQKVTNLPDYIGQIKQTLHAYSLDGQVALVHLYGVSMLDRWVDLGFDIMTEQDREPFYSFINGLPVRTEPIKLVNTAPVPIPPVLDPPKEIPLADLTNQDVLDVMPALAKKAADNNLGTAHTAEWDVLIPGKRPGVAQAFQFGIVWTHRGEYAQDQIRIIPATVAPPNTTPPPATTPPSTAIDQFHAAAVAYLRAQGVTVVKSVPVPGKPFYRLTNATIVKVGNNARCHIDVYSAEGRVEYGVKAVNLFQGAGGKGELIVLPGEFNFGSGSAYTPPQQSPYHYFLADAMAFKDSDNFIRYNDIISDEVFGIGDLNGQHTEWALAFTRIQ